MRLPTAVPQALIERLDALLRRDPQRAKVEMLKHLDGDLMIVPRPSGERRAEISGRSLTLGSLLHGSKQVWDGRTAPVCCGDPGGMLHSVCETSVDHAVTERVY